MAERIGFVGVGRMGSNMARRLKEQGYAVTAVYDVNAAGAQALAQELGCQACTELREVTKLSDVIITVVTDDAAMKKIFSGGLLSRSKGKLFINCATITSGSACEGGGEGEQGGRDVTGGVHGVEHHAGARGNAVFDVRREAGSVRPRETDSGKAERVVAIHRRRRERRRRSRRW